MNLLAREQRKAGRSILITGPWGCGKTFLWKKEVASRLKRPCIYVSAFGAESPANLKGRLLTHFALALLGRVPVGAGVQAKAAGWLDKIREKFGRTGKALASSLNSLGGSFLRRADIDPLELADLLDAETVICIDDIERISESFKIEDLLGVVNVLTEHKGFDVVLVCDEDKLKSDDARAQKYARYKEKAISTELHVSADPTALFDRVAESVVGSESARQRIQAAKATILEVFDRSKTENLRLLAKICTHIETMCAAGVRELTPAEVRFLAAISVHIAVDPPKDDGFFEFNPFAIRVIANMASRSKTEEPQTVARKAFLERYVGDADYEFHEGVHEVVSKGRIDPIKFERPAEPQLVGVKKTLATVTNGAWRFCGDAEVETLLKDIVGHIDAGDPKTARDVLDCLAYARFLANILGQSVTATTTTAAEKALVAMAGAGDESLGNHWEIHMSDLMPWVKGELEKFTEASTKAKQQRLKDSIIEMLRKGEVEGVARLLGESDWAPLQAVFESVGLDAVMELRRTDGRMFAILIQSLQQGHKFSSVWPPIQGHLEDLSKRLKAVAEDPKEERMARWRARGLLK